MLRITKLPLVIISGSIFGMMGMKEEVAEAYPLPPLGEVRLTRARTLLPSWKPNLQFTVPEGKDPILYRNAVALAAQGLDGLMVLIQYLEMYKEQTLACGNGMAAFMIDRAPIIAQTNALLSQPITFNPSTESLIPDLCQLLRQIANIIGIPTDMMMSMFNIKVQQCAAQIVLTDHQIYEHLNQLPDALAAQIIMLLRVNMMIDPTEEFGIALGRHFKYYTSQEPAIPGDFEQEIWTIFEITSVAGFQLKCDHLDSRRIGRIRYNINKCREYLEQARKGGEALSRVCEALSRLFDANTIVQIKLTEILPNIPKLVSAQLKLRQIWIPHDADEPSKAYGFVIFPDQSVMQQSEYSGIIASSISALKACLDEIMKEEGANQSNIERFEAETRIPFAALREVLSRIVTQETQRSPLDGLEDELYNTLLWIKELGVF